MINVLLSDEKGEPFSSLFMTLPSKRKLPMYYQRIGEPIDLTTIEKNIVTGMYKNVELFDKDMNKLIMNNVKYYGRTSDFGIAAIRLRKEYNIAKLNYVPQIKEIIGDTIPPSFMPVQEDPGELKTSCRRSGFIGGKIMFVSFQVMKKKM